MDNEAQEWMDGENTEDSIAVILTECQKSQTSLRNDMAVCY